MGLLGICLIWGFRTWDTGLDIGHGKLDTRHGTRDTGLDIGHGKLDMGKQKCIGYQVSGKQTVEFAKIRRM